MEKQMRIVINTKKPECKTKENSLPISNKFCFEKLTALVFESHLSKAKFESHLSKAKNVKNIIWN